MVPQVEAAIGAIGLNAATGETAWRFEPPGAGRSWAAGFGGGNLEETVGRLGGEQGGTAAWIGYEFLYIAPLLAFAAAGQLATARREEAEGQLDNLLARRLSEAGVRFVQVTIGGWDHHVNEMGQRATEGQPVQAWTGASLRV